MFSQRSRLRYARFSIMPDGIIVAGAGIHERDRKPKTGEMNMKQKLMSVALAVAAFAGAATATAITDRKTLTLDGARRAIAAAIAQAHKNHAGGVIAVVDDGGNLMALERVDGTFAAGANISIGKARTAALFQKPTRAFEEIIAKGRTAMVALNDFTPLQGGVPITIDGQVVGAVGVSGAASAQQDEELAMTAAAAVSRGPAGVTVFDSAQVQAAFDKGAVLFNQGESYMVHASRREKPGLAEIHTKDADIVYVLDGTATLVTGGAAVDAKATEPDELRGSSISGGEAHSLKRGDVIIVPAGVPHWFKEVSNPFLYYVVKAR
jgi:glc operon protein GlcG